MFLHFFYQVNKHWQYPRTAKRKGGVFLLLLLAGMALHIELPGLAISKSIVRQIIS